MLSRASAQTANGKELQRSPSAAPGFADRSQSIPVHFAIEGDADGLRAGQFVTVFAETGGQQQGIAVPRSAAWCAPRTVRTSSTSTSAPSASSRGRCASSRSTASACWCCRDSRPASASSCRAPNSSTRCAEERSMFTFLVTQSLRNRLLVLALQRCAGGVRAVHASRGCRSTCCPTSTGRPSPS